MKTFLISYDLRKQGRDYDSLIKAIQKLPGYTSPLKSVWFVQGEMTATNLHDFLRQYMDANDLLMVIEIASKADWHATLEKKQIDWMAKVI